MILAGDIGDTNTRLALFDDDVRLRDTTAMDIYPSQEFDSLSDIVRTFMEQNPSDVDVACFGLAGPVRNQHAKISNLAWEVDGRALARDLGASEVDPDVDVIIANVLEVTAHGVGVLEESDFVVLNEGDPHAVGNQALIAAGTGLGEAGLYWDGATHRPFASEGGHTDFAPRNELEAELLLGLAQKHPRVSYESFPDRGSSISTGSSKRLAGARNRRGWPTRSRARETIRLRSSRATG